jgi:hypothetical protein
MMKKNARFAPRTREHAPTAKERQNVRFAMGPENVKPFGTMFRRKVSNTVRMRMNALTVKARGSADIATAAQGAGDAAEREKSIRGISTINSSLKSNRKVPRNEKKAGLPYYPGWMGKRERE